MTVHSAIIDGKPVVAQSSFGVVNPANGIEIGRAPAMGEEDLARAIAAAKAAFPAWSAKSDDALQAACIAVTEHIKASAEELARLITLEQGKPLNGMGSRWEMGGALAWAGHTAGLSLPVKVLQDNQHGLVELHRKPLGVVGSITPWNFPVMIGIWHIMPALRTGNTVVIKPSPLTPLSTIRLVEIMNEVLPPGVVNVVTGDDSGQFNLGAAMAAHPDVKKVVFTGSCATGQKVMRSAAETIKHLTLELGGNDAAIVLPDANPAEIAEGLFWGAFINNGQTCAAIKRLYVHESIHDAVCDELVEFARGIPVGDGALEPTLLGPIQNPMQFAKVSRLVADAKARGKVLLGGEPAEGLFFPPTIIAGLSNGDPLVDEEQFGPALPIIKYSNVEDALRMANDSEFGLGGSVWSSDIAAARKVAARMECGSVWINKHAAIQPNAPFGGVKGSGFGVEFADEGMKEYTDIQVIFS
ncbi:aldehyde dehydrogenase [Ensifer sp. Root31]|uniref:aldehyde dehydrogenase family protein n=1 Tax=Ensifer sp. Root31 TaxID=1736512 RepID=UPI00070C5A98|nr:aldehyde dehydrogenase family protein [Ensifer sp. Root31]KQU86395.1 aldehyde dehydrogenase [Ensifer sp. Root31]